MVNDLPPKDRDIAMVFQNYALSGGQRQRVAMGRAIVREPQAGGKSPWTARLSKESRVWHGGPLELSVDTRYLQFFDPGGGLSTGHPKATAELAD